MGNCTTTCCAKEDTVVAKNTNLQEIETVLKNQ
jgi:hypothetical protein